MKLGDFVQISSLKKKLTGLVIGEASDKTEHWTVILDAYGNIVWWPPDDLVLVNSTIEVQQKGDTND